MTNLTAQADQGRSVPLDFDPTHHMLTLVRIRLEPFSLEMPSERDVANLWKDMGLSVPLPTEDDMRRLEEKVWDTLPKLRSNLSSRNLRLARAASGGAAPLDNTAAVWETKVRELNFEQLVELAEANGLTPSTSPNPGLRVMQTRNALYAKIRKDGELVHPTSWRAKPFEGMTTH